MKFEYFACSEKGSKRKKNEDRVMVCNEVISEGGRSGNKETDFLALVCDGVGGAPGGDIAAEMVAESFKDYSPSKMSPLKISRHIHKMNRLVVTNQLQLENCSKMATTVAGIVTYNDRFLAFNLGDTRVYKIDWEEITLLSRDHTLVYDNKSDFRDIDKDVITGYIGGDGCSCHPSIRTGKMQEGDSFLICSDGIYKTINDPLLKEIIRNNETLEQKADTILELSLEKGSTDDMSMVLIKCY